MPVYNMKIKENQVLVSFIWYKNSQSCHSQIHYLQQTEKQALSQRREVISHTLMVIDSGISASVAIFHAGAFAYTLFLDQTQRASLMCLTHMNILITFWMCGSVDHSICILLSWEVVLLKLATKWQNPLGIC